MLSLLDGGAPDWLSSNKGTALEIHAKNIIRTEQIVFTDIYTYARARGNIFFLKKKKAMSLKGGKEWYMGGFRLTKEREKSYVYIIVSKVKEISKKLLG